MSKGYRHKALREKGRSCDVCGASENIEVHHIDGNNANNDLENLVPLCRSHHNQVHSGKGSDERVQELAEELGSDGDYARFTVGLPEGLNALIDERAENRSRGALVRELLEESIYGETEAEGVTQQATKPAEVERLEDEVQYLRDVVHRLIEQ